MTVLVLVAVTGVLAVAYAVVAWHITRPAPAPRTAPDPDPIESYGWPADWHVFDRDHADTALAESLHRDARRDVADAIDRARRDAADARRAAAAREQLAADARRSAAHAARAAAADRDRAVRRTRLRHDLERTRR